MRATIPIVPREDSRAPEDADLERRIANFLLQQKVPHSERVHADAHLGRVVVSGRLESKREKWLCLETCQRVAGVIRLIDQVVVQRRPSTRSTRDATPLRRAA